MVCRKPPEEDSSLKTHHHHIVFRLSYMTIFIWPLKNSGVRRIQPTWKNWDMEMRGRLLQRKQQEHTEQSGERAEKLQQEGLFFLSILVVAKGVRNTVHLLQHYIRYMYNSRYKYLYFTWVFPFETSYLVSTTYRRKLWLFFLQHALDDCSY